MKITPRVAIELAHHEALVRQAYKDSVGVWTWSVGITSQSGHKVEPYIGKPQSLEHCLGVYVWALEKYAATVRSVFKGHNLTEEQFAAALSFHYNTGAIARASWVKRWKEGDVAAARKAFMAWRKPAEIIPRRQAECDLFFDGVWHNRGTMPEYTRLTSASTPVWGSRVELDVQETFEKLLGKPADDVVIKPPARAHIAQSTTLQATAGTAVAGAGGVFAALAKLDPTTQAIVAVCAAVALMGLGWIARERIRKWVEGDR